MQFDRREDANQWIYRRHTGSAEGEGRIQWGPLDIQRFSGDRSVLDVIDFVGRNADFSDEDWRSTKLAIESRKSSTLTRLLESAPGRKHLSISSSQDGTERTPLLGADSKWALKVLRRMIEDVRDGIIDSRDLNRASDIENYFRGLPRELQPAKSRLRKPRAFKEINLKPRGATAQATKKRKTKKKATPRPRKTLAPKRHTFDLPASTKGQALLREAALLDADKFTLSAAFVLRGFVELAISDYMDANNMPKIRTNSKGNSVELTMTQRGEHVLKHIISNRKANAADMRGFRNSLLTKTSPTSIQSLNGFVHNKFQFPMADALRAGWDASVPVFVAAFGQP